eukprot:IDg17708t1
MKESAPEVRRTRYHPVSISCFRVSIHYCVQLRGEILSSAVQIRITPGLLSSFSIRSHYRMIAHTQRELRGRAQFRADVVEKGTMGILLLAALACGAMLLKTAAIVYVLRIGFNARSQTTGPSSDDADAELSKPNKE